MRQKHDKLLSTFLILSFNFELRHYTKAPGPGQYDEVNGAGFVSDMNKKVVSRNGVFGSTSERFGSGPGVVPGSVAPGQGLTLVHFSAQPSPFWSVSRFVSSL